MRGTMYEWHNTIYHYLMIGRIVAHIKESHIYIIITSDGQLKYFQSEENLKWTSYSCDSPSDFIVYCELDWGINSFRVHYIARLSDFKVVEHKPKDFYDLDLDVHADDFPELAIAKVKDHYHNIPFYICHKRGWDMDGNDKLIIEDYTEVEEENTINLFNALFCQQQSRIKLAGAEVFKEAFKSAINKVESLDLRAIAKSAQVNYFDHYEYRGGRGSLSDEKLGETGYKTSYDYLDCYLKTLFPIKTAGWHWSSGYLRMDSEYEPDDEQKEKWKKEVESFNKDIKSKALASLDKYNKDDHISYLVREQVQKHSVFYDEEKEKFKEYCVRSKIFWGASSVSSTIEKIKNEPDIFMQLIQTYNSVIKD